MMRYDKNSTFKKNDDYFTPKYAWENIKEYIPQDTVIWEAFYHPISKSADFLRELGFNVISENIDFFENNLGETIVTNPPYSKTKEILTRLVNEIDKPFILILPCAKITTKYFKQVFKGKEHLIKIIIPSKRISFIDKEGNQTSRASFDTYYYCYKINLPNTITWL